MSDCISRKAAIKAIEDMQDCYNGFSDTYDKACIIGVLEDLPPAKPLKDADYIELEHRYGKHVAGTVKDMIEGKGVRWKI